MRKLPGTPSHIVRSPRTQTHLSTKPQKAPRPRWQITTLSSAILIIAALAFYVVEHNSQGVQPAAAAVTQSSGIKAVAVVGSGSQLIAPRTRSKQAIATDHGAVPRDGQAAPRTVTETDDMTDPISTTRPSETVTGIIEPWAEVWTAGNLRAAPGVDAAVVGSIAVGDHLRLSGWAGDWWRVHTEDGDGWVSESLLIVDPEAVGHVPFVIQATPQLAAAHVINGGNLRAGPDGSANIVAGVDAGDMLQLVGQVGAWWQVRTAAATSWIHRSLVELDPRGAQTIPVTSVPDGGSTASSSVDMRSGIQRPAQAIAQPELQIQRVEPQPTSTGVLRLAPQSSATGWTTEEGPGNLVRLVDVNAPHALLASSAVGPFYRARSRILWASGVDYLGQLDDAFRSIGFVTQKAGVANRSWHKAGRAIDVAQWLTVSGQQGVVFIRDARAPGLWRVLVRCARQDGSHGAWYGRTAVQGRGPAAYYVDATTLLESEGWRRIGSNAGVTEAWHYQYTGGLSWWQAMAQLYSVKAMRAFFPQ